jgi:NitT/TauT family transport system substrate-binding protein
MTSRPQLLLCAAIFAAAATAAASAEDLVTWRHGIVEAKSDAGFVMMPSRHDFAAKQGLKIEFVQLKGDALVLKAFLAGELDSYEGSPGGAIIAAAHGADVKIVGCYWPGLTYGLFARNEVKSVADVKGRAFGISSPGSLPDLVARALLAKNGMTGDDVRFAIMGSDADRFRALSAGVIDVAAISSEFQPLAAAQGVKLLVHAHDELPQYLRFCITMSGKTLASRNDAAVRFLTAEMQGFRYALAHRDEEIALTREIIGAKPDDPRPGQIFDEVVRLSAVDPTMPLPMDKLAWMQELLGKTGNLPKPGDLDRMVDRDIAGKARSRAGQ